MEKMTLWKDYSINSICKESDNYAVFELGDSITGEVLFIGYGHLLSSLIMSFPLRTNLQNEANAYRFYHTKNQNQCKLNFVKELKKFYTLNKKFPMYNKPNDMFILINETNQISNENPNSIGDFRFA